MVKNFWRRKVLFGWLKKLFKPERRVRSRQVKAFNFDKLDPVDEYEWRNQK
jgi:hypothetical protein